MQKRLRIFLPLLLIAFLSPQANARQLNCKVVGISDGDTLTCLFERTPLKVRLQHIDAPESGQPFGQRAKQALSRLAFKKQVRLDVSGYDRYQRLLAVVYDERQINLNLQLVEQGMAWAYRQTQPIYQQAQQHAQQSKIGLWQDPNPINPADWRHQPPRNGSDLAEKVQNLPTGSATVKNAVNCQFKRTCKHFADYADAFRHFQQCGWAELDGNGDGIPCNKLYRKAQKR